MLTRLLIMRPDQPHETREVDLPDDPGYDRLKSLLQQLLDGAHLERIAVLADFAGGLDYRWSDMFVDSDGLLKELPRNEAATGIYRRAALQHEPRLHPESLSFIAGPAILLSRRVWF